MRGAAVNSHETLTHKAGLPPVYPYETYVMNYLLALRREMYSIYNHPLQTQLHLPLNLAFNLLLQDETVASLAQQLNCLPKEVFAHLARRLDEWDDVCDTERTERLALIELDAEKLLVDGAALRLTARLLGRQADELLDYLFDETRIARDMAAISDPSDSVPERAAAQIRFLAARPLAREKIMLSLDRWDWWDILERWVKPGVRAEVAARLSAQTPEQQISRAQVLHELFGRVKSQLQAATTSNSLAGRRKANPLQATHFGSLLPDQAKGFWERLESISAENTAQLTLDALNDAELQQHEAMYNVEQALHLATAFLQNQVQPITQEFTRVDVFGILVLRHRFQAMLDELLSNAQHYASLDQETYHAFSYFRDLIRFNCHGEYRLALHELLNVRQLSLRQMRLAYTPGSLTGKVPAEAALQTFTLQDNPRFNLATLLKPGERPLRPPRMVNPGELLIAVQTGDKWSELLCLTDLSEEKCNEIRAALPRWINQLVEGPSLIDRLLDTPLTLAASRQLYSNALLGVIEDLTRCLVLSEANTELSHEIPDTSMFARLPAPPAPSQTLVQPLTLDQLRQEIQLRYQNRGYTINLIKGI